MKIEITDEERETLERVLNDIVLREDYYDFDDDGETREILRNLLEKLA